MWQEHQCYKISVIECKAGKPPEVTFSCICQGYGQHFRVWQHVKIKDEVPGTLPHL